MTSRDALVAVDGQILLVAQTCPWGLRFVHLKSRRFAEQLCGVLLLLLPHGGNQELNLLQGHGGADRGSFRQTHTQLAW